MIISLIWDNLSFEGKSRIALNSSFISIATIPRQVRLLGPEGLHVATPPKVAKAHLLWRLSFC